MGEPQQKGPMFMVLGGANHQDLTVKEYAAVERVSERTVWQWISKGAISVRRTPGGGVRIPQISEVR